MGTFVTVVHIVTAVFLIVVVLIQGGHSGGIGAAFGGGNSSGVFGAAGATTLLGKITYGAAAIFMLTSISLTMMAGKQGHIGLKEKLKAAQSTEQTSGDSAPQPAPAPAK